MPEPTPDPTEPAMTSGEIDNVDAVTADDQSPTADLADVEVTQ